MRRLMIAIVFFVSMGLDATTTGMATASTSSNQVPSLQNAGASSAYTGTAEVSDLRLPRFDLPAAALADTGTFSATVQFEVRDRSHFRVDIQITGPALDTGMLSVAANGTTITSYDGRSHLAFQAPIPRQHRAAILDDILGSLESGAETPFGAIAQPDPTRPVSTYLSLLRHPPFSQGVHYHARLVGQDMMLGHPVDIIDYGPTTVRVVKSVCTRTAAGTTCRPSGFHGSGSVRLWVDRAHPFILAMKNSGGLQNVHDIGYSTSTFSSHVTSVTYGQGASSDDLRLQLPVPVVHDTFIAPFEPRGGDSGPGLGVSPPGPFVYPGSAPGGLTTSEGIQRLGSGPHYKITQVSALFSTGQHGTSYFYKPKKIGPMPYVKGPYLLVQERLRPDGLPASLQVGTPQTAGTCQARSGTYTDGQVWIAFIKKNAAILITTNALTTPQLVSYVRILCP